MTLISSLVLLRIRLLLATLLLPACGLGAAAPPRVLTLWDFDQGIANSRGGRYNVYQREPSWARTYLDRDVTRGPTGHLLRVSAHREAAGFCGLWLDFFPGSEVPARHLDARAYRYLSLWVKGEKGGEDFEIELTDEENVDHEEARPRRPLDAYLPGGMTTKWQEVVIPLADFQGLDRSRLVRMALNLPKQGDSRFYLDDIALKRDPAAAPPPVRVSPVPEAGDPVATVHRALWVWNTPPLFDTQHGEEADRFFAFCAQQKIAELYLASEFAPAGKADEAGSVLRDADGYRNFLARAHHEGMKVEALAGTPEWAVKENHPQALAAVEAILAFNRASSPEARFDGVHFDVEPYALVGYSDPAYQPQILTQFLEMIAQCSARTRAENGFPFSCDVPAWFYPAGEADRVAMTVAFNGQAKTVGEHLTDLLESVTIMDYTNQADGAGGIIARGLPALASAAAQERRVVVGLETFLEPDTTVWFACGLPAEEFRRRLATLDLRNQLFFEGFRISVLSDNLNMHIGLAAPREMRAEQRAALETALANLARQLGAAADPGRYAARPMLETARAALARDPEWKGFEPFEIADPETHIPVAGFRSVHSMSPRITFHGLGRQVFEEEFRSTVEWLGARPGFGGMAIHFYESYRELVEGK
jgi:hypothetical protein